MPSVKGYLDRINPWHEKPQAPPPITVRSAILILAAYAILYFLPFYLSSATRPSPDLTRDAPSAIQSRIRSVLLSCTICTLTTWFILTHFGATPSDILHLTGLWPVALASSLRALGVTALLFLGPLFNTFVVERAYALWLSFPPQPLAEVWGDWATWRNLVAGPVTEELLFRSASVPLMLLARASIRETVFLSPVIFGLAHFHHFYECRLANPGVPFAAALARSLFQLAFTTVFGAYATFIYVRTGSLLAVCAVHAFCNCMGLPRLWGRVTRAVPVKGGKDDDGQVVEEKASLKWTAVYYVLLVAGAVGFYRNFWAWTESPNALVPSSAFGSARI